MRRPIVGISSYAENARWGQAWDMPASLLPQAYVDSVAGAGAVPVLLPPVEGAAEAVRRLDALLLPA
uniref:gamma-glutamyl-gamma-aminobutyrate hydrolase family protein n=1 Tax=Allosalinactinospora lopnorensis TaxID=1352348 RepID=UPI000623DB1F